jgi:excisionase family DNA binding protein
VAKDLRSIPPSGLSVPEIMFSTGLARATVYAEINSGRLKSFKVGRRRLISPQSLEAWVRNAERAAS